MALALARQVASDFPDGAWFVELAGVTEPAHVPSAIAQTLSVIARPGEVAAEAVERFLGPKRALLVLDNFEHLLLVRRQVSTLLSRAPRLTSRGHRRAALRVQAGAALYGGTAAGAGPG